MTAGFRSTAVRDLRLRSDVRRRPSGIAAAIPLSGLVDWWDLTEASGSRYGAANSTALLEGGGTTSAPVLGRRHQSLVGVTFSADAKYLATTALTLTPGTTGVTVAIWGRPRSTPAYATLLGLINSGGTRRWQLAQEGGVLRWYCTNDGCSADGAFDGATWRHMVGRYTPTGALLDLWLDGVKQTSVVATAPSGDTLQLRLQRGDGSYAMTGEIGQVGLWARPLSDAECVALYNGGIAYRYSG